MKELILVVVGAALVNNIILSQFQGLCPFLGVSKKTDTAAGMGMAVIFVITLSSAVTISTPMLYPCASTGWSAMETPIIPSAAFARSKASISMELSMTTSPNFTRTAEAVEAS